MQKQKKQKQKYSSSKWTSQSIVGSIKLHIKDKQTQEHKISANKNKKTSEKEVAPRYNQTVFTVFTAYNASIAHTASTVPGGLTMKSLL